MPKTLDTITAMKDRTLFQIDMRTPEMKRAVQTLAAREARTVASLFLVALVDKYPELNEPFMEAITKAVKRKPNSR